MKRKRFSKINWCMKKDKGIRIIESKDYLVEGYLKKAKDSIGTMDREKDKNIVFAISAGYYAMYYSLYAVLQKIGIKCEIHDCTIEFMKQFLMDFYSDEDVRLIESGFSLRNTLQYYINEDVNKQDIGTVLENSYDFYVRSRDIVGRLKKKKADEIKSKLGKKS